MSILSYAKKLIGIKRKYTWKTKPKMLGVEVKISESIKDEVQRAYELKIKNQLRKEELESKRLDVVDNRLTLDNVKLHSEINQFEGDDYDDSIDENEEEPTKNDTSDDSKLLLNLLGKTVGKSSDIPIQDIVPILGDRK